MNRPSGDQNGNAAPSVPGTAWASTRSSGRIQIRDGSPVRAATNASRDPSGESASCAVAAFAAGDQVASGGGSTSNFTVPGGVVRRSTGTYARDASAPATTAVSTAIASPVATAGDQRVERGRESADDARVPVPESARATQASSRFTSPAFCQRPSGSLSRQRSTR